MPTTIRKLPENPSLEHLKGEAKRLVKQLGAGEAAAQELVAEFDPRASDDGAVNLAGAQRVIARSYGFSSWSRLKDHVQFLTENTRWPEPARSDTPTDPAARADHLLQLAVLNYTQDRGELVRRARDLLAAEPELATANAFTMAATGAYEELSRLLIDHPDAVRSTGGPFDWPPLLYLTYGRLGDHAGRSAVRSMQVLLEAGADPNAGYLWQGMQSPFTALTGVLGGGEQDQPAHPEAIILAKALLEAGADPNDNQALYNRMFRDNDDHLELLFDYGLGEPFDSIWRRRLGDSRLLTYHYPTPHQMVTEQTRWAASHGMINRIRLLLSHGVDPDGRGYHPNFGDQTAYQMAVLAGFPEIAQLLADAGADTSLVDGVDEYLGACLTGDAEKADRLSRDHPDMERQAQERQPDAVVTAASLGKIEAVRLLLDRGFAVNGPDSRSALHHAAHEGAGDLVHLLLDRGADPTRIDGSYAATPAGWAEHGGHPALAEELRAAEQTWFPTP